MIRQLLTLAALLLPASAPLAQTTTDAEVRKIDTAQGKLTLKHGEIKNLDMPAMTMVFRVKDAAMLDKLAVGDKLRVAVERIDGQYVVTLIEPVK